MVLAPMLLILATLSGGDDVTTVTVDLSPWASQVHCPGESGRAGRDRDPVARYADLETASIPTELDFGRYRHAQEVTDSMSIETVDTRARAAAAVAGSATRPRNALPPDRGATGARSDSSAR
jgi:hypothetical protein